MPDGQTALTARGEGLASHRDGRGAPPARRDDREYREYLKEEQRRRRRGPQRGSRVGVAWGCIARRMQPDFHHGLPGAANQPFSRPEQLVATDRLTQSGYFPPTYDWRSMVDRRMMRH